MGIEIILFDGTILREGDEVETNLDGPDVMNRTITGIVGVLTTRGAYIFSNEIEQAGNTPPDDKPQPQDLGYEYSWFIELSGNGIGGGYIKHIDKIKGKQKGEYWLKEGNRLLVKGDIITIIGYGETKELRKGIKGEVGHVFEEYFQFFQSKVNHIGVGKNDLQPNNKNYTFLVAVYFSHQGASFIIH